ncbi:MAG: DUF21 domain-containing protein [Planctomycetales bacterium]|nr:DUF21 domain-containing protein [Planctomycetales bacterium]
MEHLTPYIPHLTAMAALIAVSAFFSCSEAALFYLRREQREEMAQGTVAQRAAVKLLERPELLLTSILFWNLVVNLAYFALATVIAIGLTERGATGEASLLTVLSLLTVIVFCEMLPKNLGVVWPMPLAALLSLPLGAAIKVIAPVAPVFGAINRGSARMLLPSFESEPYLELSDLERAITLSGSDEHLVEQERAVLSRVVALADTRVEEIMRPRLFYEALRPPVTLSQLTPQNTVGGYVLVTESGNEEIAGVIDAGRAALSTRENLDRLLSPVMPAPWCASAADTLSRLDKLGLGVAAVLNELGETIGVVTRNDLLASVLHSETTRGADLHRVGRIRAIADGQWDVAGVTTLRRFAKSIQRELPPTKGITIAGMLQEQLNRMPQEDDEVEWGGFRWRVSAADHPALLSALVTEIPTPTEE